MGAPEPPRRLMVNADDFGNSSSINQAVGEAHRNGILTTASLMTGGSAFSEAVELARENPRLGVGLHLAFVLGEATAPARQLPRLAPHGRLPGTPVRSGLRFRFDRALKTELSAELDAQFEKFAATGLKLDHVNGHLHFHLHPAIFPMLLERLQRWNVRCVRLTRDPLWLNLQLARGRLLYRISHALVFHRLSERARPRLVAGGIRFADRTFGLLQDSRIDEPFLMALLNRLPAGTSELYAHPSMDRFKHELAALTSPSVLNRVRELGIQLIRGEEVR